MVVEDIQFKAAEMMKKVLTVGVGALFLTEEALRGLVSDFKLPKELLSAVLDSANKTKEEFFKSLSKELIGQLMERINVRELVDEILTKHEMDLQVKVNFKSKKTDTSSIKT
jgi:hypothetical protein